jgi:flavin reductase (DIM6/NTAB) family NADH-FMN oxidoreductase RutF
VTQVSFDPLLLALSVNREHASYPLLQDSRAFAVSVLARGQLELARHFGCRSGREVDKLAGIRWRATTSGAPMLLDAVAWLECRLVGQITAGDHELVLGEAVGGQVVARGAEPLGYRETGNLDGSEGLYPSRFPGRTR